MKIIQNNLSGQIYKLLRTGQDTNGELLEMEVTYRPLSVEPPAHYHPQQTEHFRLLSGEMMLRMGDQVRVFKAGDTLVVSPNTPHSMWNASSEPAVLHWQITPALDSEFFFETMAKLAVAGKTNNQGVPGLLQLAVTMPRFSREFRLTKPPFTVLRLVFGLLAPVAYLLGFKAVYK